MRRNGELIAWALAAVVAVGALPWIFPRAFPYFPQGWEINKAEAEALALELLRDLGPVPEDPFVVSTLAIPSIYERRLQLTGESPEDLLDSRLAGNRIFWNVQVYTPGAPSNEVTMLARLGLDGELLAMRRFFRENEGEGTVDRDAARERAENVLSRYGFDLVHYDEPELRATQRQSRTDLSVRFRDRERRLGDDVPYGVEVTFAGPELTGFQPFLDDPREEELEEGVRPITLMSQLWVFLAIPLLPLVAIAFLRRYHAGEIGVRRGTEILAVVLACGLAIILLGARSLSAGWSIGLLTREQVALIVTIQFFLLFFVPIGLLAFLGWSVGEVWCRERRGRVLAGFDAFFKRAWANATFAREALVGLCAGLVWVAFFWSVHWLLREQGVWVTTGALFGPWWEDVRWLAIVMLAYGLAYGLYTELFGRLFLVSGFSNLLGRWGGRVAAVAIGALLFFPPIMALPLTWSVPFWWLYAAGMVFLFLRYGILTSILASFTHFVVSAAVPLLSVADNEILAQAALALVFPLIPLLASFRWLGSARELVYRYEDIPPHVRRIAERERQRVELETARGIQSSILPELPPRLQGVDLAHAYLPATEVGGDFYDVLALEDGRLAVAVGDVAGHGVSSGLVMSMAKSALAVQVTFDPEVASVFRTLNRTVYQSARRRLLTTLCYAVLDPQRRELLYASAGHLFPYRISQGGLVEALESVSYPLGVRGELEVAARKARLEAGDSLFLFSDGVVEARAEGSEDLFGFERLEASLQRHAGESPGHVRDGVLEDVQRFVGPSPREDDLTIVVLRLP